MDRIKFKSEVNLERKTDTYRGVILKFNREIMEE